MASTPTSHEALSIHTQSGLKPHSHVLARNFCFSLTESTQPGISVTIRLFLSEFSACNAGKCGFFPENRARIDTATTELVLVGF